MAVAAHDADDRSPSRIDWKAGVEAGVIAGAVFMALEMAMVRLFMGESPWAPPRMIAAIVLGESVLPAPGTMATFSMGIVATAMIVHFALSVAYGLIAAALVHRFDYGYAMAAGAAFGLALYFINFYPIAAALFPWFAMARNGISIFTHLVFGGLLGVSYVWLRDRHVRRATARQRKNGLGDN